MLSLQFNGWDSQYLCNWIAMILVKEQLGYNVAVYTTSNTDYSSLYSNPKDLEKQDTVEIPPSHANLEKWDLFHAALYSPWSDGLINLGGTGFLAQEGGYTTDYFVDQGREAGYSADWWYAYLQNDQVLNLTSYDLSDAEVETSHAACLAEAANDGFWDEWEESDCVDGFFITAGCKARMDDGLPCGNLILMQANWASELILSVVGLELPLRMAFLGYSGA